MIRLMLISAATALAVVAAPAPGQVAPPAAEVAGLSGTRLDVVATADVRTPPDVVIINAGVSTQAPTAAEAIRQNGERMTAMRAALRRAGIAERDLQTSNINLNPDYRHDREGSPPTLLGYRANNELSVRFRDIANAGRILDALVGAGANTINGPMFSVDNPGPHLNQARLRALAVARERAELYARTLGMRVQRILAVSEADGPIIGRRGNVANYGESRPVAADIIPGEQVLSAVLTVSFELVR